MTEAIGYAHVNKKGEIDVATVSPHKRGAMVNALYVKYHVAIMQGATEDQITESYLHRAKMDGCSIQQVRIAVNCTEEA